MCRKIIGGLAVLAVWGCIGAGLFAQDSARRISSRYRSAFPGDASAGSALTASDASVPPGRFPGAGDAAFAADPNIPDGQAFLPAELNSASDGMRSVLKRAAPAAAETQTALPPTTFPAADALPRRRPSLAPPAASTQSRTASGQPAATARSAGNVTFGGKTAPLKVEVVGPQGVTVGKPSLYTVHVTNEGDQTANEVQVRVAMPAWVSVQGVQPSSGEAGVDPAVAGRLVWNIPSVAPRSRETIQFELTTRQGDAFDLEVEWAARPAAARASIVVKQPQIALTLAGPSDMVFGEEKTFTLSVSNPGSGDAERVIVSVTAGDAPPQQFDAGTIPAGHKKEVPLAVVASQAGTIDLAIVASGENGLEARTAAKIDVRKAEVRLALEGPPQHFAGSEASYLLTVANHGTAAAENIQLSLTLPPGAKYLSGLEGATPQAGSVKWKIGTLPPGADRQYDLSLVLTAAGTNQVTVESQAAASGSTSCVAETVVEAVADLKLVVNDPAGPLTTASDAVYEVQVVNRGSLAARQVKIIMQFSEGIEPVRFEGCEARLVPGQVLCQPLPELGPGEQATLRVVAKAEQAGNHQFRVEVTATDADTRLVSEGTTRFFADTGRSGAARTAGKTGNTVR